MAQFLQVERIGTDLPAWVNVETVTQVISLKDGSVRLHFVGGMEITVKGPAEHVIDAMSPGGGYPLTHSPARP